MGCFYKLNKNPERFKGKRFAFAGLAISVVLVTYFVYTYGK